MHSRLVPLGALAALVAVAVCLVSAGSVAASESRRVNEQAGSDAASTATLQDSMRFLSQANPEHWKYSEIRTEMRKHLDLTLNEASLYIKGDYAGSVTMYDKIHEQILCMADMLAMGIEMQFPAMFSETTPVNATSGAGQTSTMPGMTSMPAATSSAY